MRSLLWANAFLGFVFVGLSLASFVFQSTEPIPESPPSIKQTISEIQDIERLRKVALLLVYNSDEMVRKTNKTLASGIQFLGLLCAVCAVFFIANALTAAKGVRDATGQDSSKL